MAWPTTDNPRTEFITLRLTVDEAADVDWLKTQMGTGDRSKTVRRAVDRVVAAEKKRARRQKKAAAPGPRMRDEDDEQDGTDG